MSVNSDAINLLVNVVYNAVDTAILSAPFDKSYRGYVVAKNDHTYTVKLNNTNYSIVSDKVLEVGESIIVVALNGDFNNLVILSGQTESEATNLKSLEDTVDSVKAENAKMAQTVLEFSDIKDQIDGNITTWYNNGAPTLSNEPAVEWTTAEEKSEHIGDIYYDYDTKKCYKFKYDGSLYLWEQTTDNKVVETMAEAAKAQDTADGKRRVFYETPTTPYDKGDLWVEGLSGDIYYCSKNREITEKYYKSDWLLASKYTDDTAADAAQETANTVKDEVDDPDTGLSAAHTKISSLDADTATIGKLFAGQITADDIVAGKISVNHEVVKQGVIENVLIANLAASKIDSGTITGKTIKTYTSKDDDGHIEIFGSTIKSIDDNLKTRVQIGKDGDGDYSMYVYDKDGNLLWRPTGITGEGIGSGTIMNDNVNDNAAISGSKLDIDSVVDSINNDGTKTIDGSHVHIGEDRLDVVYSQIQTDISNLDLSKATIFQTTYVPIGISVDESGTISPSSSATASSVTIDQLKKANGYIVLATVNNILSEYSWYCKALYDGSNILTDDDVQLADYGWREITDTATSGELKTLTTEFNIVNGQISSYVGSSTLKDKIQTDLQSVITQEDGKIAAKVEQTVYDKGMADKASKAEIIMSINNVDQKDSSGSTITINADKLNLNGYVTMSNLSTSGETTINGANITTGTIAAERVDLSGYATTTVVNKKANQSDLNTTNTNLETLSTTVQDIQNDPSKVYRGTNVPTVNNYPASSWTKDQKLNAVGALYMQYASNGITYGYSWYCSQVIDDTNELIDGDNYILDCGWKSVNSSGVISSINQSTESISINADKINLNGYVTVTDLSTAGSTKIDGGNITTGTINANDVKVINIDAENIKAGTITFDKLKKNTISSASGSWVFDSPFATLLYDNGGASTMSVGTITLKDTLYDTTNKCWKYSFIVVVHSGWFYDPTAGSDFVSIKSEIVPMADLRATLLHNTMSDSENSKCYPAYRVIEFCYGNASSGYKTPYVYRGYYLDSSNNIKNDTACCVIQYIYGLTI